MQIRYEQIASVNLRRKSEQPRKCRTIGHCLKMDCTGSNICKHRGKEGLSAAEGQLSAPCKLRMSSDKGSDGQHRDVGKVFRFSAEQWPRT